MSTTQTEHEAQGVTGSEPIYDEAQRLTKEHAGRYWLRVANETDDPISMCGAALCGLLEILTERDEQEERAGDNEAELRELEQLHDAKQQMLEDTLAAVKKSTSKLADTVREILEPVVTPPSASDG